MKYLLRLSAYYFLTATVVQVQGNVDFAKEIQPIFQKSCLECHGAGKQKGDLRLDTKEAALKGGKNGPAIVAGKSDKSDLFHRIILGKDSDDVMPPKGDLLTKTQTDLIKAWIDQGANWPDGLVIKEAGAEGTAAGEPVKRPEIKPTPADLKATATLEGASVSIRPIAQNTAWKEASFRGLGTNVTDATIAPLKDIVSLVDLNLAGTKITDNGLAAVKTLTNLAMLHLEHTKIGDAGLAHLKTLVNLEYLNLFDTQVTDAGLKQLQGLTKLKHLYTWQSKVTDAGIKELQKALPGIKVYNGFDIPAPVVPAPAPAPAPKKEEKPAEKK